MRSAEVAHALRDLSRHIGRGNPGRASDVFPGACERLVDGGERDLGRLQSCSRKRCANGWRDNLRDTRFPHKAFLVGVRFGMLARGVGVDEIVRQTRPADQSRRAAIGEFVQRPVGREHVHDIAEGILMGGKARIRK